MAEFNASMFAGVEREMLVFLNGADASTRADAIASRATLAAMAAGDDTASLLRQHAVAVLERSGDVLVHVEADSAQVLALWDAAQAMRVLDATPRALEASRTDQDGHSDLVILCRIPTAIRLRVPTEELEARTCSSIPTSAHTLSRSTKAKA